MGFWENLGKAGVDTAMNTVGGVINAAMAKELGDYEREQNFRYNEKAAQAADKRHRAQFHDLYSYSAQVNEMKKAGLNPALMYEGASGQGGATAPQGLGSGGVQKGISQMDMMSMAEMELMESQVKLNEAEAKKVGEETIAQEIQNYINDLTKDTSVQERKQNLQVLIALGTKYLSESKLNIAKKDKTQWEQTWEQIKSNEELNLLRNQNALYLAQITTEGTKQDLNEQQTSTLSAQIDKWQMDVTQRYFELDIASWNQEAQENWWKAEAQNLTDRLEFDAKKINLELDFGKKKMWIDNVFDVGKTAVIATGMIFTRGSVNLSTPKVTIGKPNPVGFH